jgi:hypothetical protein
MKLGATLKTCLIDAIPTPLARALKWINRGRLRHRNETPDLFLGFPSNLAASFKSSWARISYSTSVSVETERAVAFLRGRIFGRKTGSTFPENALINLVVCDETRGSSGKLAPRS